MVKAKPEPPEPPLPLLLRTTRQFDRDVKRQEKRSTPLAKLHAVIETLRNRRALERRHNDHALTGER